MAVRVEHDDVQEIMDPAPSNGLADAMIAAANRMINGSPLASAGLGTDVLFEIERFLAAHLIAFNVGPFRQAKKEAIGDGEYSIEYTGKFDEFLKATSYGQTVLMLDTSKTLISMGKGKAGIITFVTPEPYGVDTL